MVVITGTGISRVTDSLVSMFCKKNKIIFTETIHVLARIVSFKILAPTANFFLLKKAE